MSVNFAATVGILPREWILMILQIRSDCVCYCERATLSNVCIYRSTSNTSIRCAKKSFFYRTFWKLYDLIFQ